MFKEGCTFMISYKKLFELMKKQGKTTTQIREQKIIGQETLRKLKKGTGILEEYDYRKPDTKEIEKKTREISVDTKSIESLCTWLKCQPNSIIYLIHGIMLNGYVKFSTVRKRTYLKKCLWKQNRNNHKLGVIK